MKKTIISILFAAVLSVFYVIPAYASPNLLPESANKTQEDVSSAIQSKIKRGAYFLLGVDAKLKNYQEQLDILKSNRYSLQKKIDRSKINMNSLQDQLKNLSNLISSNTEKIRTVKLVIAQYENLVAIMENDIERKTDEFNKQGEALDKALFAYYVQTNSFWSGRGDPNILALLASNESTGEILKENSYLFFLQDATQELAKNLMASKTLLDEKRQQMEEKKSKLYDLRTLLNGEQRTLLAAQESQSRLLNETQGKQKIYEALLELSKKEEVQVAEQVSQLKENFSFFQQKLDELKNSAPAGTYDSFDLTSADENVFLQGTTPLSWPVAPSKGLSALYKDTEYEKALGIVHDAIDIRIAQGSAVKTAADGVVTKAADNGFAYSYVIIAHQDKLLTLYGHLSEIIVSEGEIVKAGQIIGMSGGMPGTKGAGWLTTGPHLHFEVFKDFKHVDPLDYLPLEFVPVGSLPDAYLKKLTNGKEEKVKRE